MLADHCVDINDVHRREALVDKHKVLHRSLGCRLVLSKQIWVKSLAEIFGRE